MIHIDTKYKNLHLSSKIYKIKTTFKKKTFNYKIKWSITIHLTWDFYNIWIHWRKKWKGVGFRNVKVYTNHTLHIVKFTPQLSKRAFSNILKHKTIIIMYLGGVRLRLVLVHECLLMGPLGLRRPTSLKTEIFTNK